jgi:hypothetical protein
MLHGFRTCARGLTETRRLPHPMVQSGGAVLPRRREENAVSRRALRVRIGGWIAALALLLAAPAAAQPAEGTVSGSILDAQRGQPIPGARVVLIPDAGGAIPSDDAAFIPGARVAVSGEDAATASPPFPPGATGCT